MKVEIVLKQGGSWTVQDIANYTGSDPSAVKKALQRMERINVVRTAHIFAWTREQCGERLYIRPVYAYGDKPNAKRPKPFTGNENTVRSRSLKRKRVASVWEWRC